MELLRAPAEPLWSRLGNIRRRHRAVTKGSGVVFTRTAQFLGALNRRGQVRSRETRLGALVGWTCFLQSDNRRWHSWPVTSRLGHASKCPASARRQAEACPTK